MNEIISIIYKYHKELDDINDSICFINRLKDRGIITENEHKEEIDSLNVRKQQVETHINNYIDILKSK
jgi:hypothetical protein